MPDSTLKSALNPSSLSPWEAQRETKHGYFPVFEEQDCSSGHFFCPYCQVVFMLRKSPFTPASARNKRKNKAAGGNLTPALLRLSKDVYADEWVTWCQEKGHSKQNFSLLLFLFYSDISSSCEDQIKNNHQDKFKFPKKFQILPCDLECWVHRWHLTRMDKQIY